MFIIGKPIRFGYKIRTLCGSDGYPYHLKIYTGREASGGSLPLGTRVVNNMVGVIEQKSDTSKHQLFFDNFFTSFQLLESLAERSVKATGTIRENSCGGAMQKLPSAQSMNKMARGTFDYRCNGTVYIARWNDNSVVNVASNYLTHEPLHNA